MTERKRESAAEEAWAHRDEPEEWSEEAEAIEVRAPGSHVVSFRISAEEIEEVTEAAKREGESVSEYVRKAIAIRMHGIPIGPSVEVDSGARKLVVRSQIVTPRRTESSPYDWIEDVAPETSSIT